MKPKVRTLIVLLNWNGWKDTIECLESLMLLSHDDFAIVVVDNASSDASLACLADWGANAEKQRQVPHEFIIFQEGDLSLAAKQRVETRSIFLIKSSRNGGFAAGNNLGLKFGVELGVQYCWLLNNDTVVEPSSLSEMEIVAESDKNVGLVGSVLRYYDERETIQAFGGVVFNKWLGRGRQIAQGSHYSVLAKQDTQLVELDYLAGASILITSDFLQDVGYMSEDYFLYFEEIDWAFRARSKWKMAVSSKSTVFHKEGGAIGTNSRSSRSRLSQYYLNRNLIIFYRKFLPWLLPIAILRVTREAIGCLVRRDFVLALVSTKSLFHGVIGRTGKYGKI
ncbi:glycosyltransferase family 2 protein [Methyloversatilis sp. XJ19-13]|uniref:glycosyltransferase family 2 protein n=1 Tax=Methyloversatilis sp. XJ19-13 TaxID=2963430 RepID=UPI00211C28B9|nr:glycosyltransferase family 2 protein [Methyloversatilis sp. XJ19-13]MCQ9376263.1 glycosyltransferase family 2 protein [Methyloversatilis sp. XJ19-13]